VDNRKLRIEKSIIKMVKVVKMVVNVNQQSYEKKVQTKSGDSLRVEGEKISRRYNKTHYYSRPMPCV